MHPNGSEIALKTCHFCTQNMQKLHLKHGAFAPENRIFAPKMAKFSPENGEMFTIFGCKNLVFRCKNPKNMVQLFLHLPGPTKAPKGANDWGIKGRTIGGSKGERLGESKGERLGNQRANGKLSPESIPILIFLTSTQLGAVDATGPFGRGVIREVFLPPLFCHPAMASSELRPESARTGE